MFSLPKLKRYILEMNCSRGLRGLQSAFQWPTFQQLQRSAVASRRWTLLLLTVLKADNTQPVPVMTTWTQHALKEASWRYVPNCSCCPVKFGLVLSSLKVSEARQTLNFIQVQSGWSCSAFYTDGFKCASRLSEMKNRRLKSLCCL